MFARWVAAGCSIALLAGCADDGSGSLEGAWVDAPGCQGVGTLHRFEPFTMDWVAASVIERDGVGLVRLFARVAAIDTIDQLVITVHDLAHARTGAPITISVAAPNPDATASVGLLGRCSTATAPLQAEGTITFDALASRNDERIAGSLNIVLIDSRTATPLSAPLEGSFDFPARSGPPYTPFPSDHF